MALLAAGLFAAFHRLRQPTRVEVVRPVRREVVELIIASGVYRAVRQSEVGAEVAGLVESVSVREGQSVTAGQPVIQLRRTDLESQREQFRTAIQTARDDQARLRILLAEAETQFKRSRTLFDQKTVAEAELDSARAARDAAAAAVQTAASRVREAEAGLAATEQLLPKRTVNAPFAGVVLRRKVEPGDSVTAGEGLLAIAEMTEAEVYVETDENNLSRLRVGQPAQIIAPAFPDRPFAARLTQIGPNVDTERGVVGLRLKAGSAPDFLLPNMTVDANIEVARHTDAPALPISALLEQEGRSYLLTVRTGRVVRLPVRVLGKNPRWAALADVPAEAEVVRNATGVKEGQSVEGVPSPPEKLP